jgi:transcriptional antiterminator NusG
MDKKWFVFYTKSRQEKKVDELLKRKGFESYLPLQTVMKQWSDRKKKVEVPLFNSYIFVSADEHAIQDILQVPGVAWNIRLNGKAAVLHPKELATIRRFIDTGLFIETKAIDESLERGDSVEVIDGPLRGERGMLADFHNGAKFTVVLGSIGQVITVQLEAKILKKLK